MSNLETPGAHERREEALQEFKDVIKIPCPFCGKPIGELCDDNNVWVHPERLTKFNPKRYPSDLFT